MNTKKIVLFAAIGAIIVAAVIFLWLPFSQSTVLNYSFGSVSEYISDIFKTDVTACQTKPTSVWGPHFLASDTQYWIDTKKYEQGRLLCFQAWFYQIGGEYNTFTIERINASTTRLTVNQTVKFFITLPYWPKSERAIIKAIEFDLKNRDAPEPAARGDGIPPPQP